MKQLILASQSPRRKMLLEQVGLQFTVYPSECDETIEGNVAPEKYVEILATRKAEHVARRIGNKTCAVVLAADTIVVLEGKILGKPKDRDEAYDMLSMLQDNWHQVMTGLTVIDIASGHILNHVEKTRVRIRPLTPDVIWNYINTGEPLDKAGAYGIQGLGALLVEKLEGCYFNVVGLPIYSTSVMLARMGIHTILNQNSAAELQE